VWLLWDDLNVNVQSVAVAQKKRLHFITAIIVHINDLFDDMKILVEAPVPGQSLHLNGHFEFILQRGAKKVTWTKVCEHNSYAFELWTDLSYKGLPRIYSAAMQLPMPKALAWSSELLWTMLSGFFFRSLDDRIEREYSSLPIAGDQASKEGLKFIAGKIYALLADEGRWCCCKIMDVLWDSVVLLFPPPSF